MEQPALGWVTPVELVRVIDGDTVVVQVTKEIIIRLNNDEGDLDAPEIRRPASYTEIAQGKVVKNKVKTLLKENNPKLVIFVPTGEDGKIKDMFSIGARPIAHLFANGVDVGEFVEEITKDVKHKWEW